MKQLIKKLNIRKGLIILSVILVLGGIFFHLAGGAKAIQWWPGGTSFAYRKQLTITNSSAVTLSANTTVAITVDTQTLVQQGKLQSDCDDLRVLYQPNSSTSTEVTRHLVYGSNASGALTCSTSTNTKVFIPLQASLASAASTTDYLAYYGNGSASSPSSTDNAFDISSIDATLVCPFDGSSTCAAGETPSTATGAIRYSGSKSAVSFSDVLGSTIDTTANLNSLSQFTIEFWINPKIITGSGRIMGQGASTFYVHWLSGALRFTGTETACDTGTLTANTWQHVAVTYNGTTTRCFLNGVVSTPVADSGTINFGTSQAWGGQSSGAGNLDGMLDEIRVSNTARYSSNFTPQTTPFIRDQYTKLLLHFDENGDDPRNTGKTIDDSGNGNHGTITGAKYVGGLAGVDNPTTLSAVEGSVGSQSYAKHEGVVLEHSTTNYITNPSFENASNYAIGWTAAGSNLTASNNTTAPYYKFGSQSEKLVASASAISGTSNMRTINITTGSTAETQLSMYVYDGTSGNVGGTVSGTIAKIVYNGTAQTSSYVDMGGGWWRVSYRAVTGTSTAAEYGIEVQVSKTIYIDGVQLETSHLSTYTDGSLGSGYSWSSTVNNSTSTRATASLQYASTNNISANEATISFWLNFPVTRQNFSTVALFSWVGTHSIQVTYFNGGIGLTMTTSAGTVNCGTSPTSIDPGEWHLLTLTYKANSGGSDGCQIYKDGTASGTGSSSQSWTFTPGSGDLGIGKSIGNNSVADSIISDLRIYGTQLTSTQVTDLYQAGLVGHSEQPQVDQFSANKGEQPLSIWHMDEATGSTTYDSSLYHHDLTLGTGSSAPTWRTDHIASNNPRSTFLRFDGSNDYTSRATDTDFNPGTDSFTVGGWFRHPSTQSGTDTILTRFGTAGYKIYMNSSGFICFGTDDDSTWGPDDSACTTTSYADSTWHYFSAVKTGTTSIVLYVDGLSVGSDLSILASGTLNTSSTLYLGIDSDAASNPWTGDLDDFLTYTYARSAAQIKADYLKVARTGSYLGAQTTDPLANGLVGYWKMDENTGTTTVDASGNGKTGTFNDTPTWSTGKFGPGLDMDPTDYVTFTSTAFTSTDSWTASYWINSDTTKNTIPLGRGTTSSYIFSYMSGASGQVGCRNTAGETSSGVTVTLNTSTWYLITASADGQGLCKMYVNGSYVGTSNPGASGSAITFDRFGRAYPSDTFSIDGKMDEVRIYNRALSPAEVSQLYNFAPGPVGWWKMDEGTGTASIVDSSGNGLSGTMNGSMTNTDWVPGKYGTALDFDNNNDQISVASNSLFRPTGAFTLSAWINSNSPVTGDCVLNVGDPENSPFNGYYIRYNGGSMQTLLGTGSNFISALRSLGSSNTWAHVSGVFNGSTLTTYVNGNPGTPTSYTGSVSYQGTETFLIGKGNANCLAWDGKIDDVRVYNYARTSKQIVEDMNAGHPAGGSPVGSSVATWHMDDMEGTVAEDSSINGNDLTLSSRSWTQSGKVNGAWNGTNAVWLSRADDSDFDVSATEDYAITGWVKSDSATNPGATEYVVNKASSVIAGYAVYFNTSGNLCFGIDDDTTWGPDIASCSTTDVYDASWHHFSAVRDTVADKTYIYVDGLSRDSDTDSTSATLANSLLLYVGDRDGTDNGDEFAGDIDEVNIYRSALNATDVKIVMNNNSAVAVSVLGATEASNLSDGAGNAPVAEWLMNEGVDNTCTGGANDVCDVSGNGNDGASTGGPVWTAGKNGSGLRFDGVDDYVDIPDSASVASFTAASVDLWFKPTANPASAAGMYFESTTTSGFTRFGIFHQANGTVTGLMRDTNTGSSFSANSTTTLTLNRWYHLELTVDSATDNLILYVNGIAEGTNSTAKGAFTSGAPAEGVNIGAYRQAPSNHVYVSGFIDQVKLFNYARTAAQVAYDYNRGRPVAHWRLDECQGNTAYGSPIGANYDSTLNGTITIGASGTQTSAGTCGSGTSTEAWNGGTTGKFNSSLNFDGTDDYVGVGGSSPVNTVSFWVKPTSTTASMINLTAGAYITASSGTISATGFTTPTYYVNGIATTSPVLTANAWNHIVVTTATSITDTAFTIGKANGAFTAGQIDDVQIFNYALSATQVKKVMNEGAVRYGPNTGPP